MNDRIALKRSRIRASLAAAVEAAELAHNALDVEDGTPEEEALYEAANNARGKLSAFDSKTAELVRKSGGES